MSEVLQSSLGPLALGRLSCQPCLLKASDYFPNVPEVLLAVVGKNDDIVYIWRREGFQSTQNPVH